LILFYNQSGQLQSKNFCFDDFTLKFSFKGFLNPTWFLFMGRFFRLIKFVILKKIQTAKNKFSIKPLHS